MTTTALAAVAVGAAVVAADLGCQHPPVGCRAALHAHADLLVGFADAVGATATGGWERTG